MRSDSAGMSGTMQDGRVSWPAACSLAAALCASKVSIKPFVSQRSQKRACCDPRYGKYRVGT